jgi:hypothetical protein
MRDEGLLIEAARDRVINEWLLQGDTRALAALLIDGHLPGDSVRLVLALMLLDESEAEATIERLGLDLELWSLPYRLEPRGKPRSGRLANKNDERDRLLAENINLLMQQGMPYKVAINTVYNMVRYSGGSIGTQTIRSAFKKYCSKKTGIYLP